MTEIEVKFSIPDRVTYDRLCQFDALAGFRLEPAGVKRVHDRYLDTEDRAVFHAGYALRLRRNWSDRESGAAEAYVATLKGLGGADVDSGIHQRAEYEAVVSDANPVAWPESPVRDLTLEVSGCRALCELFALSQERRLRFLHFDKSKGEPPLAELSLDVVSAEGCGSNPYFELEIELLDQNRASILHTLSAHLRRDWGLRPEPRSKFERGLESCGGMG